MQQFFVCKNENHDKSSALVPLFFYGQSGQLWVCINAKGSCVWGESWGKGVVEPRGWGHVTLVTNEGPSIPSPMGHFGNVHHFARSGANAGMWVPHL